MHHRCVPDCRCPTRRTKGGLACIGRPRPDVANTRSGLRDCRAARIPAHGSVKDMIIRYLGYTPSIASSVDCAPTAAIIGRTAVDAGTVLRSYATLRADGERVQVGANAYFGERSTVHIAHGTLAAVMGDGVTVGRFALVHACTVDDGAVVGDTAVVMDGARVGAGAVIGAGSLVPPGKHL